MFINCLVYCLFVSLFVLLHFVNWYLRGITDRVNIIPLASIIPGNNRYSDSLYPNSFDTGWMMTGRLPPILFIRNKNIPRMVVFKWLGDTSTMVTNTMPNQVSAENKLFNWIYEYDWKYRVSQNKSALGYLTIVSTSDSQEHFRGPNRF